MTVRLFERNRTLTLIVMYSLYLYFLGLSLRNTSNAVEPFKDQKSCCYMGLDGVWFFSNLWLNVRVSAFIIDEIVIQIVSQHFWIWFCIKPLHSSVLGIYLYFPRIMLVAEKFLDLKLINRNHSAYTEGVHGIHPSIACKVLKLKHSIHLPLE